MLILFGLVTSILAVSNNLLPRSDFPDNGFLKANESFQFTMTCGYLNNTRCEEIKEILSDIGTRIGIDLLLKVPITVNVTVISQQIASNSVSNNVVASKDGQLLTIPSALAKQAKTNLFSFLPIPRDVAPNVLRHFEPFDISINFSLTSREFLNGQTNADVKCELY